MGSAKPKSSLLSLEEALLKVPNDPRLTDLILHGKSEDRSGALFRLAARLGELNLDLKTTETILRFSDSRWGKFSEREDLEERIESLIEISQSKRTEFDLSFFKPLSINELLETSPQVNWLMTNLIMEKTISLITGGTGVGKSQLALQLAISLSSKMNWLNYEVPTQSRVLYSSVEMSHPELAGFLKKMNPNIPTDCQLKVLPVGQTISLMTTEGQDFYRQFVDDFDVLVIDTLGASTHTSLSDEESARQILMFLEELRRNLTILVVHHDAKHSTGGRTEDVYGSRLFGDRASTVLRLSKPRSPTEEGIDLTFSKIRMAQEPAVLRLQRTDSLWYTPTDFTPRVVINKIKSKGDDLF